MESSRQSEQSFSTVPTSTQPSPDPGTRPGSPISKHKDDNQLAESDEDDDGYRVNENPSSKPRQISEKKRENMAALREWVIQNQRALSSRPTSNPNSSTQMSVAGLVGSDGSKKIICSPREYQTELFERAKEKNIVVVLDTGQSEADHISLHPLTQAGSGKTLIAALLMRHILDQELEDRARGNPKKIAFFIVEKVNLCFQQYQVLSCNLEYPVTKIYGNMPSMTNTKEFWDSQSSENMAVVITSQVLLDCLNNGFITMRQINLLVFDEAHHAKKNHPYARIIKSHYMRESDHSLRPRILGMTASPVDAKTNDMRGAAVELESMLCSEIATASDAVLWRSLHHHQKVIESTYSYDKLKPSEESHTILWSKINAQVSGNPEFRSALDSALDASSTLGLWCADRYWSLLMTDAEVVKLVARTEQTINGRTAVSTDRAVTDIHQVQKIIQNHHFEPASKQLNSISTKSLELWEVLQEEFHNRNASRCIVFVEKRHTAVLLADLLQQPGLEIPGVIPSYMVGSQSVSSSIASMTFRDQIIALEKFKRGDTNCLFSTPVGEEGIDIPACDVVIRFDMYNSVIQYIQSRGRARMAQSRFISLVERGNKRELTLLNNAIRDATALQQFCAALPEDRKVQDYVIDAAAVAEAERTGQKTHEIPATGARLNFENSLGVLEKFTGSLTALGGGTVSPAYTMMVSEKKFIANVTLPDASPVIFTPGFPQRSKQLARCSAAFECCMLLLNQGAIDQHLQPAFTKKLPLMRNARLAISSNKQAKYPMRLKPDFWKQLGSEEPSKLFATALALEHPIAVGKSSQPLILLSRHPLPSIPDIPLFFTSGHSSVVKPVITQAPISLSEGQLESLQVFTLKMFSDIFSKEYETTAAEMPYFLAPSVENHGEVIAKGWATVDWEVLRGIQAHDFLEWEGQPTDFFNSKLVIDPWDGSRKLILHGINPDLKPSDPPPPGAPLPRMRAYRFGEQTIKEYSNSMPLKFRHERPWRDDQPVIDAEIMSLRRNFLDQFAVDQASVWCAIVPEPLRISPIPIEFVNMATLLPAILHRIDSSLIAIDACSMLGLINIRPELALEAMTKDSDNTEEHGVEQIHFQRGMGNNYERLEFLGDSFLKMATTISVFVRMQGKTEFESHVERMLLIANKNLFNHAVDRKLPEYIRSRSFDRRTWYPNLRLKKGKAPKKEIWHDLGDKSVADVAEALIGAAYLSSPDGGMDMAVHAVTVMVKSKMHKMESFKEYCAAYKVPDWQSTDRITEAQRSAVASVKSKLSYTFQSPALLRSAFKHPSYTYESSIPNYQLLEFLGDALLDMSIVDYLFRKFPWADPQWLTEHKMAMVSNRFLGCLCVKLQLHKHLLAVSSAVINQKAEYVTDLERTEMLSKGDGDQASPDFWRDAPMPPKALPDILEAVVGAMFVDSKFDYSIVEDFFLRFIQPYFEDMAIYDTYANKNPITVLTKMMQGTFKCRQWFNPSTNVPCDIEEGVKALTEDNVVSVLMVHGKVEAHATAKSGRYAKVTCAKKALARFANMSKEAFRKETGCNCEDTSEGVQ